MVDRAARLLVSAIVGVLVIGMILPSASSAPGGGPTPASAADAFVAANAAALQVQGMRDLRLSAVVPSPSGYHVRYDEVVGGVPVYGATVNVAVDRTMTARFATSSAFPSSPDAAVPAVPARDAASMAHTRFGAGYVTSEPTLVYYPEGTTLRLAWRVEVDHPARGTWTIFTSAVDGRVLSLVDDRRSVDGVGLVFDPNPIVTSGDTSLRDENDRAYPALVAQEMSRALLGLDGSGHLVGPFVSVHSGKGPDAVEPNETFAYLRDDTRFEQVMAYYHIDHTQRYIQSLGFANVNNRPQEVKTDQFSYDNSYYNTANHRISYGRGGVDDAEDADVILHEYGHAIQDNQVPGFGMTEEGGAMGEGFGDYWAVTNHYDVTPVAWRPLVMIWDATSYDSHNPPYLRRVDLNLHYPADMTGEVHDDGEIWSRVLWDMRVNLGGVVADTVILDAQFFLTPRSGFRDGANALLMADTMIYGGAHVAQITSYLDDRGIPHA